MNIELDEVVVQAMVIDSSDICRIHPRTSVLNSTGCLAKPYSQISIFGRLGSSCLNAV